MRIAIYDGILETHVGSSLERALRRRGHDVCNTGKIGHGFKFPAASANIDHLELAVHRVIDFNADVCFVMRPASLPFTLLNKLQRKGITTVAWFSDDPVLFDLSYGPIVDSYDLVLHCGNQQVLEFYESRFGKPTGINFPFWTDHDAFPYVWGKAEPTTDLMFLGNVNDEVRRSRYFDLAKLKTAVRIHGNVGADFSGLSGGYLDGDKEVVASGRTARAALNIPQFFANHRGLETWFSGLGELGFFEYPSRVIQYMAMGLPTISIIPGAQTFRSYPEMVVADSIEEADERFLDLLESDGLAGLSKQTLSRFDRNFSADARVLALENLLASDDWKSLSAEEREVWFTSFVPKSDSQPDETSPVTISANTSSLKSGLSGSERHIVILSSGASAVTENSAVLENLFTDEYANIKVINLTAFERSLVPDPAGKCDNAVNVGRLANELPPGRGVFLVADEGSALTKAGADLLRDRGYTSIVFAGEDTNTVSKISRLSENYDLVVTSNNSLYNYQQNHGIENVTFLPTIVHPEFLELLDGKVEHRGIAKFSQNPSTENALVRSYAADLAQGAIDREFQFEELMSLSLYELANVLSSEVSLLSFSGTRANPRVHRLVAYIVLASRFTFASRVPDPKMIFPFDQMTCLVSGPGELANKTDLYLRDDDSAGTLLSRQIEALSELRNAGRHFLEMVDELMVEEFHESRVKDHQYLCTNDVFTLSRSVQDETDKGNTLLITPRVHFAIGPQKDWWFRIRLNGEAVAGNRLEEGQQFLVRSISRNSIIECELEYIGPNREVPKSKALQAEYRAEYSTAMFGGAKKFPRVTIINRS